MVSQGSNCDEDGVPHFLQDTPSSEEVDRGLSSPELNSGKEFGVFANRSSAPGTMNGSLGFIEIVEGSISDEERASFPDEEEAIMAHTTNPDVKAAFTINKAERLELDAAHNRLMDMQRFIENKGFSMADFDLYNIKKSDAFNSGSVQVRRIIQGRDEFGLPKGRVDTRAAPNPFIDKLKEKLVDSKQPLESKHPQEENTGADYKKDKSKENDCKKSEEEKTWASMLKNDATAPKFTYVPSAKGVNVVQPSDEVLKKGNEKYRTCVVGTFTKGTNTYKTVSEFAFKIWGPRGLLNVFKKDPNTFVFKFKNENGMLAALSKGTWYINRRPMVVTAWGITPGVVPVTSMPLWIKLTNVPDSYWTEEGLSNLASVIGEPRGADQLTSRLHIMPFAMIQVKYELGDPLPNEIHATILDPITEQKSVVTVNITYPDRPLYCTGCKSLGHTAGACPIVTREWRQKCTSVSSTDKPISLGPGENVNVAQGEESEAHVIHGRKLKDPNPIEEQVTPGKEQGWTEVKRKHGGTSPVTDEESPAPPKMFQNLKNIDEIDLKKKAVVFKYDKGGGSSSGKRLTKSQKKKLKRSMEVCPPPRMS